MASAVPTSSTPLARKPGLWQQACREHGVSYVSQQDNKALYDKIKATYVKLNTDADTQDPSRVLRREINKLFSLHLNGGEGSTFISKEEQPILYDGAGRLFGSTPHITASQISQSLKFVAALTRVVTSNNSISDAIKTSPFLWAEFVESEARALRGTREFAL